MNKNKIKKKKRNKNRNRILYVYTSTYAFPNSFAIVLLSGNISCPVIQHIISSNPSSSTYSPITDNLSNKSHSRILTSFNKDIGTEPGVNSCSSSTLR